MTAAAALDFSDATFAAVAPRRFNPEPLEPTSAEDPAAELLSIPEAAHLLSEVRQTTWARVQKGQLVAVVVGRRRFVRRSQVLDLRAALDARRAPLPPRVGERDHARSVAAARARSVDDGAESSLVEIAREVHALRDDLRSIRRLLLVRGGA